MFQFEIEDVVDDGKSKGDLQSVEKVGFVLGEKIRCDKDLGVIKYIGPVGSHPGIWLGIEWDDPIRGKHSGTVDDVEYFKASVPNSASFVRPVKVQKFKTIIEALHERYGEDESAMQFVKSIEDRLEKKKISYSKLKVVNLTSRGINDISQYNELAEKCPNVEALEIADNLIQDWDSIGKLCHVFKKLTRLDVSLNPLHEPQDKEIADHLNSFPKLQNLILGCVKYGWDAILKSSEMWPQITDLTVPFNCIATLAPPQNTLVNLRKLDLEKNKISDWGEILKLSSLERLEALNLCGNFLTKIRFPITNGNSEEISYFPNLVHLNLSENSISDWVSISELNHLKGLKELRLDMNPFLNENNRATNRQLIIARMEKLLKLEGVEISRQEKRDAELDYVKMFSKNWNDVESRPKFILEHPTYPQLVQKYGKSEAGETAIQSHSMKSSLIRLIIVPESSLSYKECEKKILKTMTVQKLKGLLQRMFKIPPVPIEITVVSCQNPGVIFSLDNDFIEIGQYSVDEGDTLRLRW